MERALIEEYIRQLDEIAGQLTHANHSAAAALAAWPDEVRGYGHVKEKNLAKARQIQAERLEAFRNPSQVVMMKRA